MCFENFRFVPFEKLFGNISDNVSLSVFGSTYFVLRPHVERDKLSPKSTLCVLLGYDIDQIGYRWFDPVSHKLYVFHHVVFFRVYFFIICSC